MTKEKYLVSAKKVKIPQIKVGDYPRYADIWVVVVDGRVFCRQFTKNKKGWYAALLQNPEATLKFDDLEFKILGKIPADNEALTGKINKAYIKKYGRSFSWLAIIAWLMTTKNHSSRTMELIFNQ